MQSTLREILDVILRSTSKPRFWVVFLGIIILFAITGPFDTFANLTLPMRFVYWSVTMIGSWLIAMIFVSTAIGVFVKRFDYPLVLTLVSSVLAAWPITAFLIWVIGWFFGATANIGFWSLLPFATVMAVVFCIIIYFVLPDGFSATSQSDDENPLLARLPVGIRGPIKHMTMQDHYMQVTTTRGKELILMRMGDADGRCGWHDAARRGDASPSLPLGRPKIHSHYQPRKRPSRHYYGRWRDLSGKPDLREVGARGWDFVGARAGAD